MPTAYEKACASIEGLTRFTTKNDLSHTKGCLQALGSPERTFAVIHTAGTNGKGSVCAMLEAILRRAGIRTGLFISPHLITTRERFSVNGETVSEEIFVRAFDTVGELCGRLTAAGLPHPSYFEYLFLMGMVIFRETGVEAAVLETGLGGRLDATNAVEAPDMTILTMIGLDHTRYLGDTLEAVAGEKAGIIKPGVPVVYAAGGAADRVIEERAAVCGSPLVPVRSADVCDVRVDAAGTTFRLTGETEPLRVPIAAPYEAANAALAIAAAKVLRSSGKPRYASLNMAAVREGLAALHWPGRMERLADGVYADGAHNPAGIEAFIEAAVALGFDRGCDLLFGVMADKDYHRRAALLTDHLSLGRVTVVPLSGRGADPDGVAALFAEGGASVTVTETDKSLKEAYDDAAGSARAVGRPLCVLGSLYLIGDLKKCLGSDAAASPGEGVL